MSRGVSDDELASVIAHEVGHIVARHSIKKLQGYHGYSLLRLLVAQAPVSGSGGAGRGGAALQEFSLHRHRRHGPAAGHHQKRTHERPRGGCLAPRRAVVHEHDSRTVVLEEIICKFRIRRGSCSDYVQDPFLAVDEARK